MSKKNVRVTNFSPKCNVVFKVHRILLGRTLLELSEIKTIKHNNQTKSNIIWEGQLKTSFRSIFIWNKLVKDIWKIYLYTLKDFKYVLVPFNFVTVDI
jgi:hypothetical protein